MILSLLTLINLFSPPALAFDEQGGIWKQQNAILVVLDISGSMSGSPLNGVKRELQGALSPSTFPQDGAAGLISFSGCDANDVRLDVPLRAGAAPDVIQRAMSLSAHGGTDLYNALLMAKAQASNLGGAYCTKVLVLTDGDDTCGRGNVKQIAADIAGMNECNQVNAVAIGQVNIEQELQKMVTAGRGTVSHAEDSFDIAAAIQEAVSNMNSQVQFHGGLPGFGMGDPLKPKKPGADSGKKNSGPGDDDDNRSPTGPQPNTNANVKQKSKND